MNPTHYYNHQVWVRLIILVNQSQIWLVHQYSRFGMGEPVRQLEQEGPRDALVSID